MGKAPGDGPAGAPTPSSSTTRSSDETTPAGLSCPVDHKSREVWLRQTAKHQDETKGDAPPQPVESGLRNPFSFFWSSRSTSPQAPPTPQPKIASSRLNTDREVSSIPRSFDTNTTPDTRSSHSASHASTPLNVSPNNQTSDPHTSPDGKWIYPSEEMFFNAMRRKSYSPRASDMSSVIPIHNAVNEKTWQDILAWEKAADPRTGPLCGGPKLVSFSGDSQKLTPRARWNMLWGYEKPFDRHDWVVDRCGQKIEYVIDFYAGKRRGGDHMGPSFYLDVRPKLNSLEGCKMRALRTIRGWTGRG